MRAQTFTYLQDKTNKLWEIKSKLGVAYLKGKKFVSLSRLKINGDGDISVHFLVKR